MLWSRLHEQILHSTAVLEVPSMLCCQLFLPCSFALFSAVDCGGAFGLERGPIRRHLVPDLLRGRRGLAAVDEALHLRKQRFEAEAAGTRVLRNTPNTN